MKACGRLICILAGMLCLTGCWDGVEIKERAVVMGIGIDRIGEHQYMVAIQVLLPLKVGIPSAGAGTADVEKAVWVVSAEGGTILDTLRKLENKVGRRLFLHYSEVMVIGEAAAREGVIPILDFFIRDREFRHRNKVLIAEGNTAKEVMEISHPIEIIPAVAIMKLVESGSLSGTIVDTNLFDFSKQLEEHARAPVASRISISGEDAAEAGRLELQGAAVFKGDRLVGFLNDKEARGYNMAKGKVESGVLVIHPLDEGARSVSIEIIRMNRSIELNHGDGALGITIVIKLDGNLAEQQYRGDITDSAKWNKLEQLTAQLIRDEIEAAVKRSQEDFGIDFFGFADEVYKKYPKVWSQYEENWEYHYQNIVIDYQIDVTLRRAGITRLPPQTQ